MRATLKIDLNLVQCESLEQANTLIDEFNKLIKDTEVHSLENGVLSVHSIETIEIADKFNVLVSKDRSEVYKDALTRIHDLALGYDGAETKEALEGLIDELRMLAALALNDVDLRILFHGLSEEEKEEFRQECRQAREKGKIKMVDDYYFFMVHFVKEKRPDLHIHPQLKEALERDYA